MLEMLEMYVHKTFWIQKYIINCKFHKKKVNFCKLDLLGTVIIAQPSITMFRLKQ